MVNALAGSAEEMRRLVESVRDGARAGSDAAGTFRGASDALVAAAAPVRATTERIEGALRQMADGTRDAVATVTQSARITAEAAAQTLSAARETIAAERQGVESALAAVTIMLERLRGQGDQMDDIDGKLGRVDKRDSPGAVIVIQAGICNGDQRGTKPDVERRVGVL